MIPLGSLQTGFRWNHRYKDVLGKLSHPSDGASDSPYSFYNRWADTYNVSTEFTIVQQGKALAAALCLMAQSPLQSQKWEAPAAKIAKSSDGYLLTLPENLNLNLDDAIVVWEAEGFVSPHTGRTLPVNRNRSAWISVAAHWPDGRRAFATLERP